MPRKTIAINWDKLDSYVQLRATKKACALLLGVSVDTIERRIKQKYKCSFTEYSEMKMEPIKLKLVSKAISKALDGDNTMLIFCLKNLCGWKDKIESVDESANKTITLNYRIDEDKKASIKLKKPKELE